QKLAILAEVDAPGGSVSEVARRHGLHTSLLFRWRRNLGGRPTASTISQEPPTFVPLSLPALAPPAELQPKTSKIEIVLAGGRMVRVDTNVDVSALRRFLDALEA